MNTRTRARIASFSAIAALILAGVAAASAPPTTPKEGRQAREIRALKAQVVALKKANRKVTARYRATYSQLQTSLVTLDTLDAKLDQLLAQRTADEQTISAKQKALDDTAAERDALRGRLADAEAKAAVLTQEREDARAEARTAAQWCGGKGEWTGHFDPEWIFSHMLGCAASTLDPYAAFDARFETEGDPDAEHGSYVERYTFTWTRSW